MPSASLAVAQAVAASGNLGVIQPENASTQLSFANNAEPCRLSILFLLREVALNSSSTCLRFKQA